MNDLRHRLEKVQDSYNDFVDAMMNYASYNQVREMRLREYLTGHPDAKSSEILKYVMSFTDFFDDVDTGLIPSEYERVAG